MLRIKKMDKIINDMVKAQEGCTDKKDALLKIDNAGYIASLSYKKGKTCCKFADLVEIVPDGPYKFMIVNAIVRISNETKAFKITETTEMPEEYLAEKSWCDGNISKVRYDSMAPELRSIIMGTMKKYFNTAFDFMPAE